MLCSKMTQLYIYIYIYILFHILSIMVYYRILNIVPSANLSHIALATSFRLASNNQVVSTSCIFQVCKFLSL